MLDMTFRGGRGAHHFTGTTIKHLPQERLRAVVLPIPSLDDQIRFLRDMDALTDAGSRLTATIRASERRGAALRRALLEAAFTGRLTGTSLDQEFIEEFAAVPV